MAVRATLNAGPSVGTCPGLSLNGVKRRCWTRRVEHVEHVEHDFPDRRFVCRRTARRKGQLGCVDRGDEFIAASPAPTEFDRPGPWTALTLRISGGMGLAARRPVGSRGGVAAAGPETGIKGLPYNQPQLLGVVMVATFLCLTVAAGVIAIGVAVSRQIDELPRS